MKISDNAVLNASARHHYWSGTAGFSLKRFTGGSAHYRLGTVSRRVDPTHCLWVNEGQAYEIEIDSQCPVTSRCVFFNGELIRDVANGLLKSPEWCLDHASGEGIFEVSQQLYMLDAALIEALDRLDGSYRGGTSSSLETEESFHRVGRALFRATLRSAARMSRVPAVKPSTRLELYRRVAIARDFIVSHWEKSLRLSLIASVAALSPNHLLRSFRAIYGMSPGRYQQSIRVQQAQYQLALTDQSISRIAVDCGFESLPSFIRLFRSRCGASPSQFRKKVRSDKTLTHRFARVNPLLTS